MKTISREEIIEELTQFLQKNYANKQAFNKHNTFGDEIIRVYNKNDIAVYYCEYYDYLEILGLSKEEFENLISPNTINKLKTFKENK